MFEFVQFYIVISIVSIKSLPNISWFINALIYISISSNWCYLKKMLLRFLLKNNLNLNFLFI